MTETESKTKYCVDSKGVFLGAFAGEGALVGIEVPVPPHHALDKWSFSQKKWLPWEPPTEEKRKVAYTNELGNPGDQFDAIYKAVSILVPELVKRGAISPEIAAALLPDPTAPVDTPPGWLGKLSEIKARYPKERDSNV